MSTQRRSKKILKIIKEEKKVFVTDLSETFGVTEASIRTDLTNLEEEGYIRRFHGGAKLVEPTLYQLKFEQHREVKKKIAKHALKYIEDQDTLFLDSGTTILELTKELGIFEHLTVITNSLPIASQINNDGDKKMFVIGGELSYQEQCFVGLMTDTIMENIFANKAFLGADAVSIENGIFSSGLSQVGYARKIIEHSNLTILLVDSSKFRKVGTVKITDLNAVDIVITDNKISPETANAIRAKDIKVEIVE